MAYSFNVEEQTKNCIEWIRDWFYTKSSGAKGIVIGISGGTDSSVVAKLCCEAIGIENVYGILMPNGVQKDINDSYKLCRIIGLDFSCIDIDEIYCNFLNVDYFTNESMINIAPRIRMAMLYAIGQTMGYRVVGTGNLSEKYIGFCTKWGDTAHDFNPIGNFTKTEVIQIGDYLGLPYDLVHKTPSDGLCGMSDEDKFGFSYTILDRYIREEICFDTDIKNKIDKLHFLSLHKFAPIPTYELK